MSLTPQRGPQSVPPVSGRGPHWFGARPATTGWWFARGVVLLVLLGACSADSSIPVVTLAPPTTPTTQTTVVTSDVETGRDGVVVSPGDDLAAMVSEAPEGTRFFLAAGVHRAETVVPKDGMEFIGDPGAVMSGASVLDGFVSDGEFWRLDGVEMSGSTGGDCIAGYEGCVLSQDLFMDNVMLWQVTDIDQLAPGRWLWDGDTIYVANDPSTRRVELSVVPHAFVSDADDVTISDLVIENYASPAQTGAVQAQLLGDGGRGSGWLLSNIEVFGSHGVGIRTGDVTTVRDSHVHHNGQLGIAVSGGTDVVIEDTEIAFNNVAGFNWMWEGGGLKATRCDGLVVRNTYSHDNEGPGLWTDIDAVDTLYEANRVVDNAAAGIFHEISGAAVIRDNTVEGNGFDNSSWLWGAGILIAASNDVEVYGNVVSGNADGIAGIQQERGDGPYGPRLLRNIAVHDNTIRMAGGHTGVVQDSGDSSVFTDRNIVFSSNTYVHVSGRRFAWDGRYLDRDGWLATGQDEGATWE
jgi:hypothetical protein